MAVAISPPLCYSDSIQYESGDDFGEDDKAGFVHDEHPANGGIRMVLVASPKCDLLRAVVPIDELRQRQRPRYSSNLELRTSKQSPSWVLHL